MKLIVGLGNPGEKYAETRHNVGFIVVDSIAEENSCIWNFKKKFNAEIAKINDALLVKPQTFMNRSGDTVSKLVNYYNIDLDDLIVIHDDVDLDPGQTKFKKGMGSAGHNGVEDIFQKLGSKDFWRLRVGIGRPENNKHDVHDHVLGKLDETFLNTIKEINIS